MDAPEQDSRVALLADAAAALAGELELDAVLQRVVEVAARATGARYAALGVLGEGGAGIVRFVTHGADEATIRAIGHYPEGHGLLGVLIREPRVLRMAHLAAHPSSSGFPNHHPPMTTFLGAPVRSGGRVYGNLYLTDKPGAFDARDEQLVAVLAAQAGAAVENAQLAAALREVALTEERERISRELHDGVLQTLFATGLRLEGARELVAADPARAAARIGESLDALDLAVREVRNAVFRLRGAGAAELGPIRGLAQLAREHEVNALVRPQLDVAADLDARVPPAVVPDLLAIVREALVNIGKHASSRHVRIVARADRDAVEVEVSDDGLGFDPTAPKVGRGLEGMHERAAALDATLKVDSAPGGGTRIRLRVRVPA